MEATSLMKLAVMPPKPNWLRMAPTAFSCSSAEKTGLRTRRLQIGALVDHASEIAQGVRDGVGDILFLREGEQGQGIAFRDAGRRIIGVVDFSHAEKLPLDRTTIRPQTVQRETPYHLQGLNWLETESGETGLPERRG